MARPSSRDRLLDCAERLFADHGVAGVSLRAINAEAGLSPAALHYHFGSQDALVTALLERRMPALMERRRQLLDALERRDAPPSARAVLDVLVRPLAELLAEGGAHGRRYLRLLDRLQADGQIDPSFVLARWPGGVDRLLPLLGAALPHVPDAVLATRLDLAIDTMLRSLARGPAGRDAEAHAAALLDFLTGALEAPVTRETP